MSDKRYQEEYLRRIHKVQDYIEQHTGIFEFVKREPLGVFAVLSYRFHIEQEQKCTDTLIF